jgi:hypothetical protein
MHFAPAIETFVPGIVRYHAEVLRPAQRRRQPEAAHHRTVYTVRADHEPARDFFAASVPILTEHTRHVAIAHNNAIYLHALPHLRTALSGVIQKHAIEYAPGHSQHTPPIRFITTAAIVQYNGSPIRTDYTHRSEASCARLNNVVKHTQALKNMFGLGAGVLAAGLITRKGRAIE